jgi:hypothetical protein
LNTQFAPTQLADFQRRTHIDSRSIVAEPKFVNAGHLDFRLAEDSPARSLPGDGTSVGARQRLAK